MPISITPTRTLAIFFVLLTGIQSHGDDSEQAAKLKSACKSFLDAWARNDHASAAKLTSADFFYCNGSRPLRLKNNEEKTAFLKQLRKNSNVGTAKSVEITNWINIQSVETLPIEKMRLNDDAKKLLREYTKPKDFSVGIVFENPETSDRDVLMAICRKDAGEFKIVGLFYSEPKASR